MDLDTHARKMGVAAAALFAALVLVVGLLPFTFASAETQDEEAPEVTKEETVVADPEGVDANKNETIAADSENDDTDKSNVEKDEAVKDDGQDKQAPSASGDPDKDAKESDSQGDANAADESVSPEGAQHVLTTQGSAAEKPKLTAQSATTAKPTLTAQDSTVRYYVAATTGGTVSGAGFTSISDYPSNPNAGTNIPINAGQTVEVTDYEAVLLRAYPETGYVFAGYYTNWNSTNPELFYGDNYYFWPRPEASTTLTAVFLPERTNPIKSVTVNMTAPAVGSDSTTRPAASVPSGSNYAVEWSGWSNANGEDISTTSTAFTFESGQTYYALVTLKANDGCYFYQDFENFTATVTGGNLVKLMDIYNSTTYSGLSILVSVTPTGQAAAAHTVTFDSQGGSTVASQTVNSGEHATKPSNPTKSGFYFLGWFTKTPDQLTRADVYENNPIGFDFENTAITEDMTLYAAWYAGFYGATYDLAASKPKYAETGGDATFTSVYQQKEDVSKVWWNYSNIQGSSITITAIPASGATFIGWAPGTLTSEDNMPDTPPSLDSIVSTANPYTFTFEGKMGLAALFCSHGDPVAHEAKSATCTEEGNEAYWECPHCGKLFSDEALTTETTADDVKIAKLEHAWDKGKVTTEPTCTEAGVKTFTCANCGQTKTEAIETLGHDWDEGKVTTEPTCTEAGVKTFTCKRDASHTKTEEVAALGHDWGDWTEASGKATRTCARCGDTETIDITYSAYSGDGAEWTKGSSDPLVFTFKRNVNDSKTFGLFKGIKVDGKDVAASNYAAVEGSAIISLTTTYLETLAVGDHKITATFEDGEATASFTVKDAPAAEPAATQTTQTTTKASTPKTGDTLPFALIAGIAVLAVAALGLAWCKRRQS